MSQQLTSGSYYKQVGTNLIARRILFTPTVISNQSLDFQQEWKAFAKVCGINVTAQAAWEIFEPVMKKSFANEGEFSAEVFAALRKSIGTGKTEKVKTPNASKAFKLKNESIGFAVGYDRKKLFMEGSYGAASLSIYDHSCIVFNTQNNDAKGLHIECDDMTAVVEIKMGDSNCNPIPVDSFNYLEPPELREKGQQGAFGQGIIYTLDILHCLVRRGLVYLDVEHRNKRKRSDTEKVAYPSKKKATEGAAVRRSAWLEAKIPAASPVETQHNNEVHSRIEFNETPVLPVVVLAAERSGQPNSRLCLMEGKICFPEYSFQNVKYETLRQIPFDHVNKNALVSASYIRAMRIGVQYGKAIQRQYTIGESQQRQRLPPDSLCGRKLSVDNSYVLRATHIGCPIPDALSLRPTLKISQGDMFELTNEDKTWLFQDGFNNRKFEMFLLNGIPARRDVTTELSIVLILSRIDLVLL
jgi:hypothetical protein